MSLRIRKTTKEDLDTVMNIFAYARAFMEKTGNPNQWGPNNWPPKDLICKDVKEGNSYVCVDDSDKVIGTFYFIQGKDIEPTYRVITDGAWIGNDEYGVVHRIASDGSRKGVGEFCLKWAHEQCGHLRIDTHADNKVMQNLLCKLGYVKCGIIYVHEDKNPRLAYEKIQETLKSIEA